MITGAGKSRWHTSTINKILRNEKYIGDALLQKTYTTDFLNKTRVKNTGIVPQYYVEGNHEAIIPKESTCEYRKNWCADELLRPAQMARNEATVATTASHKQLFAVIVVKCSEESTGTIVVANPSSGVASVDLNLLVLDAMPEP